MIGIEGGRINVVPVDFLVAAMDHLAHLDGLDGRTFHLMDPNPSARRRHAERARQGRPCSDFHGQGQRGLSSASRPPRSRAA